MAWFTRQKPGVEGGGDGEKKVKTEGLWLKCDRCGQIIWKKALDENLQVCPHCEHHFSWTRAPALAILFDEGAYQEHDADARLHRSAAFRRLQEIQRAAGVRCRSDVAFGRADFGGRQAGGPRRCNICAMELKFIGGSMGAVVGEMITRADRARLRTAARRW